MTTYPQLCPLARAAEIVGERWTLLIFRELLISPMRFSDLLRRLPNITPTVLTERLRDLESRGLIAREEVGPPTPARLFALTPAGRAILPAIQALVRWGTQFLLPMRPGEMIELEWARAGLAAYARLDETPAITLALTVLHEGRSKCVVAHGGPEGTFLRDEGAESADATVEGGVFELLAVISGQVPVPAAAAAGLVRVGGDEAAAARLPELFLVPLDPAQVM